MTALLPVAPEMRFDPNPTMLYANSSPAKLAAQYAGYAASLDTWQPGWHLCDLSKMAPALRREALLRRKAKVRHQVAPEPMACRWCGIPEREHAQSWVKGHGYHGYVAPDRKLIEARLRAKLGRTKPAPAHP
ncbi:hypothetical protein [Polymorphospora lycopeni]|uniref:Uncharacterized protein n=1 Tax=Polymorphospora lycopeni TaxID=3140240 RepID=A0ABV5D2R5_9ACTN